MYTWVSLKKNQNVMERVQARTPRTIVYLAYYRRNARKEDICSQNEHHHRLYVCVYIHNYPREKYVDLQANHKIFHATSTHRARSPP